MKPGSPEYEKALDDFIELRRRTFYPKTDLELPLPDLARLRQQREAEAETLASQLLTALTFEGHPPLCVQPIAQGTFHLLFRLEFSARGVLYARTGFAFRHRPNFEFELEANLTAKLRAAGIPIAEIVATDLTRRHLSLDFQLVRESPGRPLNTIENPDTQLVPDALLEDWGRTLARLHQIKATGAGLLNPRSLAHGGIEGVLPTWNDYLLLNLDHHLHLCVDSGALTAENSRAISNTFTHCTARLHETPLRLLHGDPGHHNIFAEADKISAIIDWEDALAGDPIFDVAYWGTFVRDYLRDPFLRGYREIAPLPADFEFRYWLYYLRIAVSKTAHRHLFGYKDRPGRPPASERITKALSHLTALERSE